MFKDLDKIKEKGIKIYKTSMVIDGTVGVYDDELTVGGYTLTDLVNEFVTCYGKKVRIEIRVTVTL